MLGNREKTVCQRATRSVDALAMAQMSCPAEGCEERPAVPEVRQVGLDVGAG